MGVGQNTLTPPIPKRVDQANPRVISPLERQRQVCLPVLPGSARKGEKCMAALLEPHGFTLSLMASP